MQQVASGGAQQLSAEMEQLAGLIKELEGVNYSAHCFKGVVIRCEPQFACSPALRPPTHPLPPATTRTHRRPPRPLARAAQPDATAKSGVCCAARRP